MHTGWVPIFIISIHFAVILLPSSPVGTTNFLYSIQGSVSCYKHAVLTRDHFVVVGGLGACSPIRNGALAALPKPANQMSRTHGPVPAF